MTSKVLEAVNHIQEYFTKTNDKAGSQLFIDDEEKQDIDFKTELTTNEIKMISALEENDRLITLKLGKPLYASYLRKYKRLMVSKDRKGRTEYVNLNNPDNIDRNLERLGAVGNALGLRPK